MLAYADGFGVEVIHGIGAFSRDRMKRKIGLSLYSFAIFKSCHFDQGCASLM
jgi:hypothetical protein